MMKRVQYFLSCLLFVGVVYTAGSAHVMAADPDYRINISTLPKDNATCADNADKLTCPSKVQNILSVVFGIVGALSLMMITIGGFRYITSDGDAQKAARAKGTVIYALIGLVVAISAVTIVTFVLGRF